MELADHHRRLRDQAAELARGFADIAAAADEAATPVPAMVEGLAASGLPRLMVGREFGGSVDAVDALAVTVVRESLMSVSAHLDTLFCMQGIGSYALTKGGSAELKAAWLPRVARMEALAALALTEPDAGSDLKAITTTIRQVGDELVVTGAKSYISNGGAAAFYAVLGREGDDYSMVLVPADASGLTVTPTPTIIAPHIMGDLVCSTRSRCPSTTGWATPAPASRSCSPPWGPSASPSPGPLWGLPSRPSTSPSTTSAPAGSSAAR